MDDACLRVTRQFDAVIDSAIAIGSADAMQGLEPGSQDRQNKQRNQQQYEQDREPPRHMLEARTPGCQKCTPPLGRWRISFPSNALEFDFSCGECGIGLPNEAL